MVTDKHMPSQLARMAIILTLKPLLTTPFWLALVGDAYVHGLSVSQALLVSGRSLLPAILVTIFVIFNYWPLFRGQEARTAKALIALDIVRWGNSGLLVFSATLASSHPLWMTLNCLTAWAGLGIPFLYGAIAFTLCWHPNK